jgi:hypothetical protein
MVQLWLLLSFHVTTLLSTIGIQNSVTIANVVCVVFVVFSIPASMSVSCLFRVHSSTTQFNLILNHYSRGNYFLIKTLCFILLRISVVLNDLHNFINKTANVIYINFVNAV